MKLLMFDACEFWYKTYSKTVENAESMDREELIENALVVYLQSEQDDEVRQNEVLRKAVDNIAWLARKNGRSRVVLHSFAHLSDSKSSTEFAKATIELIKEKLVSKGFAASSTPFGYFLEFRIHVRGESLAKVWKAI